MAPIQLPEKYGIVLIGGGSGGSEGARRAASYGKKVASTTHYMDVPAPTSVCIPGEQSLASVSYFRLFQDVFPER